MIGNIWISSALVVISIFSASALWKSRSDTKEAKQILEQYEIIKDIKTLMAEKYNKPIEKITKYDIITMLPADSNWERVLLLNKNKIDDTNKVTILNDQANFVLSEDERIKLLALKTKLRDTINTDNLDLNNIPVGNNKKNIIENKNFEVQLENAITFLINVNATIPFGTTSERFSCKDLKDCLDKVVLLDKNFFDFSNIEGTDKATHIKTMLKNKLEKSENSYDAYLYYALKDSL